MQEFILAELPQKNGVYICEYTQENTIGAKEYRCYLPTCKHFANLCPLHTEGKNCEHFKAKIVGVFDEKFVNKPMRLEDCEEVKEDTK